MMGLPYNPGFVAGMPPPIPPMPKQFAPSTWRRPPMQPPRGRAPDPDLGTEHGRLMHEIESTVADYLDFRERT